MGSTDLRDIVSITEVNEEDIEYSNVVVDAPNWLYKYLSTTVKWTSKDAYTSNDGNQLPNLIGGVRGLRRFYEMGLKPVFVFDGVYHEKKSDEIEERRLSRENEREKAKEAEDKVKESIHESRSQVLTGEVVETTKRMFDILDIEYMEAPMSAESQAAYMVQEGFEYMVSEDYDSILFGSPVTIRNFTSSSKPFEKMSLENTLEYHEINREQLVDIAILCGTDYNEGVYGIGPKTALDHAKDGSVEEVVQDSDEINLEEYEEVRQIFLQPTITKDFPSPRKLGRSFDDLVEFISQKGLDVSEIETSISEIEESAPKNKSIDDFS